MKSSQSNFDLRSASSYLARSYLIATVINELDIIFLPVIDWSQRRHCDSAKWMISAKIKATDNIQNLISTFALDTIKF